MTPLAVIMIVLSVTGFYPHYLWNTGDTTRSVSVSTAGNYTVTVSSSMGCVGISDSLNLIIDTLDAQMVFTNRSVYTDFVCTTPGVVTVFWDFGDGSTSDAQSISYVYANPGVYPIILIVSDSFCSDTIYQNINILISQEDSVKTRRDQVWSADEKIFFSNQVAGDYRVQLFDLNGKRLNTVFSGYLTPQKHIFPVPAGLPAGLFIIRVESESEVISSKFLSGY